MSEDVFYTLSTDSVTLWYEGEVYTTTSDSKYWEQIKNAVRHEKWRELRDLIDLSSSIKAYAKTSHGAIEVRDGGVYFGGQVIHGALIDRILDMRADGFEVTPMVKLLENIMKNPSYSSREQLYRFLEANKLPITPDGCFLAYKRIRLNWKDCHSGTMDNSIGQTVKMRRELVDDDPNRTCSAGLHVCSLGYLGHFYGERVVAVKVNPKDVVSVPVDYENSKMRVSEYYVLEELKQDFIRKNVDAWDKPVVKTRDEEKFIVINTDDPELVYNKWKDEWDDFPEKLDDDFYFDTVEEAFEVATAYSDSAVRAVLAD